MMLGFLTWRLTPNALKNLFPRRKMKRSGGD